MNFEIVGKIESILTFSETYNHSVPPHTIRFYDRSPTRLNNVEQIKTGKSFYWGHRVSVSSLWYASFQGPEFIQLTPVNQL